MLANHYIDLAGTPISDTDFYGSDVRYSAEFEILESELDKAHSLHQIEGPDWSMVREGCEALLRSQSKDLRAAVWLTWSLYHQESIAGLQAGLAALTYLSQDHWAALHPRKPRTRLAAFSWLASRVDQAVSEASEHQHDPGLLNALADQLRALDTCLAYHFDDQAPLLLPLSRRIEALVKEATAPPAPSAIADQPAQASPAKAPVITLDSKGSEPLGAVTDHRDAHKCLRLLQEQARHLSHWWLGEAVTDARAIRLSRTLLWLPIDSLPEHDAQYTTTLRGLPADRLSHYRERLGQGAPAELLIDIETSLARAPFWLDGQRMAWQCLEQLGGDAAQYEIEAQLAMLLKRLPGLERLCFHDQTPFADADTQAWLQEQVLQHHRIPSNTGVSSAAMDGTRHAPWEAALQDASAQLRKGSLKVGLQAMKQAMQQADDQRSRFHWQLAQARLCQQARQYELAWHQLESLYQVLHHSGLEQWEPDLALRVLRLLLECGSRLPDSPALRQRKSEIYQRLCHLDLEAALDQACGPSQ